MSPLPASRGHPPELMMMQCGQCGHSAEEPFTYCPACGSQSVGGGEGGLAGRTLKGKYRVIANLGSGSMGSVYLAEHTALQKKVALKVLHRDLQLGEEAIKRFQREGVAAGKINHRNVIQVFDFDQTRDGTTFLAMEYVDGRSLRELLTEEGDLSPDRAIDLVTQLLETLAAAHEQGVVHRDLKPENLMVVAEPDGGESLKVLDFGLSKLVDRRIDASLQTMAGRVMGTPLYMSPEQWNGVEVDSRSDIYSTGLILYELLTGVQPFKSENITETLMKSTTEDPPSVLDQKTRYPMPVDLDPVLATALEKEPDERFQTADEMLEALEGVRMERVRRAARTAAPRKSNGAEARRQGERSSRPDGGSTVAHRSGRGRAAGRRRRPAPAPTRSNKPMLYGGITAGVAAIATVVAIALGGGGDAEGGAPRLVTGIPREERSELQQGYVTQLTDARDLLRSGDAAGALAAVGRAVRSPVVDAEAFLVRAMVYRRQGDAEAARLDYQDALERRPDYGAAIAGLGWLLLENGNQADAEKRFAAAAKADPDCGPAYAGLAALLLQQGKAKQALALLDGDGKSAADDPLVQAFKGEALLLLDRLPEARAAFTQAKRGDSSLVRAYRGLAIAAERAGELEMAEQQCIAGLAVVPDARPLQLFYANLLLGQGRADEALPVLSGVRGGGQVRVLRGLAHQAVGEEGLAIEEWQNALEDGVPQPAKVELLLAMLHAGNDTWEECAEAAAQAVALDESLSRAWFYRGLAAYRLGDPEGAAEHLEQAVARRSVDLDSRYTLGVLYMDHLGRPADALAQFEAYEAAGGEDPRVQGWLEQLRK